MALTKTSTPKEPRRTPDRAKYAQMRSEHEPTLELAKTRLRKALIPKVEGILSAEAMELGMPSELHQALRGRGSIERTYSISLERYLLIAICMGVDVTLTIDGFEVISPGNPHKNLANAMSGPNELKSS